jgi:sensor c-di-GMP phosphodiesterase-like protein
LEDSRAKALAMSAEMRERRKIIVIDDFGIGFTKYPLIYFE